MNKVQKAVIAELRLEGYAVVVFTPEELENVNSSLVEDELISRGNSIIEDLAGTKSEDEED